MKHKTITWENCLNTGFKLLGHISLAKQHADALGYPFFLWNDRVYEADGYRDTGYTAENLRNGTATYDHAVDA